MAKIPQPQNDEKLSSELMQKPPVTKEKPVTPPQTIPAKKEVDVSRGAVPKVRRTETKPENNSSQLDTLPNAIVVDAKDTDPQKRGAVPKRKRSESTKRPEKSRPKEFNQKSCLPASFATLCRPPRGNDFYNVNNACLRGEKAKVILSPEPESCPFRLRTIWLRPNIECQVGRLLSKNRPSASNAIFDSKVLSRYHAVLWFSDDGRFWIKDTKSSNGTFINGSQLFDGAAEMYTGDVIRFGCNIMENQHNELHNCILANVRLYLPDGTESTKQREKPPMPSVVVPTFDQLQHLNEYMEETAQNEKVLNAKMSRMKGILDSTKANSAKCWQALMTEDQLLQRIHSLEKMLQVMQQNASEDELRVQMAKMVEDKELYEQTAKQVLRKVHQERLDAKQLLNKALVAQKNTESECEALRKQVTTSKRTLKQTSDRLLALQAEYREYKENTEDKQHDVTLSNQSETTQVLAALDSVFMEQHCARCDKSVEYAAKHSSIVSWLEGSNYTQPEYPPDNFEALDSTLDSSFNEFFENDSSPAMWMNETVVVNECGPKNLDGKLADVQQNLQQLELNIARALQSVKIEGGVDTEDAECLSVKNVELLKQSVAIFHEVYDDFCAKINHKSETEEGNVDSENGQDADDNDSQDADDNVSQITAIPTAKNDTCKKTTDMKGAATAEADAGGETVHVLSQKLAAALKEVDEMSDIMQVEYEVYEQTLAEMENTMTALREENQHLEYVLNEKIDEFEEEAEAAADAAQPPKQTLSDTVAGSKTDEADADAERPQRNDDLSLYRTMLLRTEQDNNELRQLIWELQNSQEGNILRTGLFWVLLPGVVAFLAAVAYFMINYK